MKKLIAIFVAGYVAGAFSLAWLAEPWLPSFAANPADSKVSERVEMVTYRTRLPHAGCVSNGCWNAYGTPARITAYGIDKHVWPHKCDGCGATNTVYDASWPKFRREWRVVK